MDTLIRKTRNEKRVLVGYIAAFVLLFLIYLISLSQNKQLTILSERVNHTTDVINTLESISSTVKDAETGVRGYVLTKDMGFLSPYIGTEESADSLYLLLLQLTNDNPLQKTRLARLKRNIDQRFEVLKFIIENFEDNQKSLTDTVVRLQPESRQLMTTIRSTVEQMQEEENRLLDLRREKLYSTFRVLNIISFASLAVSFLLCLFVVITYLRSIRERMKALLRVRDYQNQLTSHIDELNKANGQLLRMRSQEKFTATGRIARTIAHEVRNPLTNINLANEQLKAEIGTADENKAYLFELIERNSSRINQLISDLLNSTKFSELSYGKVSVNTLLDEALEEAADRISLTRVKVIKKYSNDICDVSVDKGRIKIGFLNIIINAVEAMEGGDDNRLVLETKGENGKCKIVISDNGVGMDNESVSNLFEPYFTSKPKGNGLGLTNAQNIILNHKGEISVESSLGKGTSFTILLDFAS